MVLVPIQTLIRAGIRDITLVIGGPFLGQFPELLRDFDAANLSYVVQRDERGIADALLCAQDITRSENLCLILGDNCTDADISGEVELFERSCLAGGPGCHLFLRSVPDPERFGVAAFDDAGRLKGIVEKPKDPPSNWAVAGIYLYTPDVFRRARGLRPSKRGELEISDLNNSYIKEGLATYSELSGFWADAGTPESYARTFLHWVKRVGWVDV